MAKIYQFCSVYLYTKLCMFFANFGITTAYIIIIIVYSLQLIFVLWIRHEEWDKAQHNIWGSFCMTFFRLKSILIPQEQKCFKGLLTLVTGGVWLTCPCCFEHPPPKIVSPGNSLLVPTSFRPHFDTLGSFASSPVPPGTALSELSELLMVAQQDTLTKDLVKKHQRV